MNRRSKKEYVYPNERWFLKCCTLGLGYTTILVFYAKLIIMRSCVLFPVIQCATLPSIHNGKMVCTGTEYGKHCTFSCDDGYDLQGNQKRVCQLDGTWSGKQTSCKGIYYLKVIITSTSTNTTTSTATATATATAMKPQSFVFTYVLFIKISINPSFYVLVKLCPALRRLAFGTVHPADCVTNPQPYGRGCVMKCVKGYESDNPNPLTCGMDGRWQGKFPTCRGNILESLTCAVIVFF